jgi:hypothetical protein
MSQIRFFTDEDIHGQVALQLRALGFDALSTPETGRLGRSDPEQLKWSAQENRALVTFNVSDFARLHHEWMIQGRSHSGVIVSRQRPLGDLIKRLLRLAQSLHSNEMEDRLEYLSNWQPA